MNPKCECGWEMELEKEKSYYSDYGYEWVCHNPKCKNYKG